MNWVPSQAALVGRVAELEQILAGLHQPEPAAFVITGAPGVGKTRLANEAAEAIAGSGFATGKLVATQAAASIPFGAFMPFLPVSELVAQDLTELLGQAGAAIAERVRVVGRFLLVVDDAHLLDHGSAALVHQLVYTSSCSVVATVRTPGQVPESVTALWKDGLAQRISLDPLSEEETEDVVVGVLGGPVTRGGVRRLWEMSGGNALYLRELLIGAAESEGLSEHGGMWSLSLPVTAPERLVELVASRLGSLPSETVAAIELLSLGEPMGFSLLEVLSSAGALEDAERSGLVEVRQEGRRTEARIAHPIYGEVLRQRMPESRRRRMSAVLADALESTGVRRREDLLRLARLQLDAGGSGNPVLLGQAARRASEMFDMELAMRLARRSLDSGGGVDAGLVLGESLFRSGHHEEAELVLAGLVDLCSSDTELAQVADARAYNMSTLMGDPSAAEEILDDALGRVTDVMARLRLLARVATNKIFEADPVGALAAAEEILASRDDLIFSRGTYTSSMALALLGRGDEAVDLSNRGMEARRRCGEGRQLPEVQLVGAVLGHMAVGRLDRAEAVAATGYQACLAAGDKEGQATFSLLKGSILVERGQLGEASMAFGEASSINRELHDTAALRWSTGGLALAEGMAGHAASAHAAEKTLDELPAGWTSIFEADLICRGRAWVCVSSGELSRARDVLRTAAEESATSQQRVVEARLLHDIARLGDPDSVLPRLVELAHIVDGDLVAAFAQHAEGIVRASAADLDASARRFEAFGMFLLAAEATGAAAATYRSQGSSRSASNAKRRATDLLERCGDVRTPGLSQGENVERLTRREYEIAGLAAAGAPSRDIAAKLFVSVRTVDNHLQSVYSKLGVTNREDLAVVLHNS